MHLVNSLSSRVLKCQGMFGSFLSLLRWFLNQAIQVQIVLTIIMYWSVKVDRIVYCCDCCFCCWASPTRSSHKNRVWKRNETKRNETLSRWWSMSTRHSTALIPPPRRRRKDIFRWLCSRSPHSCLSLRSTRDRCVEAAAFPVVVAHVLPRDNPAWPNRVVMEIAWLLAILIFASVFPKSKAVVPAMNVVLENAGLQVLVVNTMYALSLFNWWIMRRILLVSIRLAQYCAVSASFCQHER